MLLRPEHGIRQVVHGCLCSVTFAQGARGVHAHRKGVNARAGAVHSVALITGQRDGARSFVGATAELVERLPTLLRAFGAFFGALRLRVAGPSTWTDASAPCASRSCCANRSRQSSFSHDAYVQSNPFSSLYSQL
jgi:hypothetical protein